MDFTKDRRLVSLSVLMPVYNEREHLRDIVQKVLAGPLVRQLVIVDDGSTDGSKEIAEGLAREQDRVQVLCHRRNRGKGAAIRTGLGACNQDLVIIQDADLEYDPSDYGALVEPIEQGRADAVFGSRFLARSDVAGQSLAHRLANRLLTGLSNRLTGLALTDVETCYKCFKKNALDDVALEQARFGIEIELTAKLVAAGCLIEEVPIRYRGRTRDEGKKIGFADGLEAVWCILKYRPVTRLKL